MAHEAEASGHAVARSPHWPAVRHAYLQKHGTCAACGAVAQLEVHHKKPFHLFPALELDPRNFLTLCEGPRACHLHVGHLGDWKNFNRHVVRDAAARLAAIRENVTPSPVTAVS